jgi:hypothetical protein
LLDNDDLSLALLEAGILFVDHIQSSFPADDDAVNASFLDGWFYFHLTVF